MKRDHSFDNYLQSSANNVILTNVAVGGRIACVLECQMRLPDCVAVLHQDQELRCILLRRFFNDWNSYLSNKSVAYFLRKYECSPGWREFNNHCYFLNQTMRTWNEAKVECQRHNAYLVEVESSDENTWVTSTYIKPPDQCPVSWYCSVWSGGMYSTTKQNHVWQNSEAIASYTNWDSDQPSGGGQNCINIWKGGKWDDAFCGAQFEFVCEKP
ncbi:perlucin-like protein [Saccostrea echinata]|uniref:perlucin-like protein n=1 Tax=Saccostrea echinata TaxID=191078 RepID=UPI002A80B401|nr:perlucin-like protein [Saccostrea echinata]